MEITEKMLDVIEAVKGRREPQYWDNQCKRFMTVIARSAPFCDKEN